MNKFLSTAVASALMVTAANADFIRVEGGVGVWQSEPTGVIGYAGSPAFDIAEEAGLETSEGAYLWVYLKHPVPIIPNVRFEYNAPSFSGQIAQIEWNGDTYASVSNTLELTQYDAVLYYNILDNTLWSTIDIGLDIKLIEGSYALAADTVNGSSAVNEPFDLAMVLPYVRARVQIPITEIGVEAIVRGASYTSNTIIDAQIKVDYTMDFVPVIQPGIEIGYRHQQIDLDGDSIGLDANFETTFSGVYGGIMVRF